MASKTVVILGGGIVAANDLRRKLPEGHLTRSLTA